MFKIVMLLLFGAIETYLFAWWTLSANRLQEYESSMAMLIHMVVYLIAIKVAINANSAIYYILIYSCSCAVGNFIRIRYEKKQKKKREDKRNFIIKGV